MVPRRACTARAPLRASRLPETLAPPCRERGGGGTEASMHGSSASSAGCPALPPRQPTHLLNPPAEPTSRPPRQPAHCQQYPEHRATLLQGVGCQTPLTRGLWDITLWRLKKGLSSLLTIVDTGGGYSYTCVNVHTYMYTLV